MFHVILPTITVSEICILIKAVFLLQLNLCNNHHIFRKGAPFWGYSGWNVIWIDPVGFSKICISLEASPSLPASIHPFSQLVLEATYPKVTPSWVLFQSNFSLSVQVQTCAPTTKAPFQKIFAPNIQTQGCSTWYKMCREGQGKLSCKSFWQPWLLKSDKKHFHESKGIKGGGGESKSIAELQAEKLGINLSSAIAHIYSEQVGSSSGRTTSSFNNLDARSAFFHKLKTTARYHIRSRSPLVSLFRGHSGEFKSILKSVCPKGRKPSRRTKERFLASSLHVLSTFKPNSRFHRPTEQAERVKTQPRMKVDTCLRRKLNFPWGSGHSWGYLIFSQRPISRKRLWRSLHKTQGWDERRRQGQIWIDQSYRSAMKISYGIIMGHFQVKTEKEERKAEELWNDGISDLYAAQSNVASSE